MKIFVEKPRNALEQLLHAVQPFTDTLTVILSETYREEGQLKHILLLSSDVAQDSFMTQGAPLSVAIFVQKGAAWQQEIRQENFASLGEDGYPPSRVRLQRIGPQKYGIVFEPEFSGAGGTERSFLLYASVSGLLQPILSISGIESEMLDTRYNDGRRVVMGDSTYGFVESGNSKYYDFQISTWGIGGSQRRYVFNGTEYVER